MKKTNLQPLSCNKNSIEIKILWKQKYCEKKYCGIVFDESQHFLLLWGQGQKQIVF